MPPEAPSPETSNSPVDQPDSESAPDPDLPPEAPSPETSNSPVDQPDPESAPDPDLPPEAPSPETSNSSVDRPDPESAPGTDLPPATPSPEASDDTIDEAKIAAEWDNLGGYLKEQDDGLEFYDLFGIFDTFGEPGQVNQFFDENNQPKLDVSSFHHFTKQTPEQIFQTVVMPELNNNTGFEPQLQENFAAGLAYQLLQGEMLRYMIIVPLNEGSGSVLLLSNSLPGLEPQMP
ncbi:hypothetical protein [Okeania sp. SIO2G5]|uniref:hypothetical protein n=1 Tax=Okeania sp. SIO2G5 TaxID=2607796 RepID=UPI0013C04983|nr:hypothetical protein [Okeania sp. SIO2G5]NEP76331.1 hypothetical protein [Okeania sp. SIO2G5]